MRYALLLALVGFGLNVWSFTRWPKPASRADPRRCWLHAAPHRPHVQLPRRTGR